MSVRDLLMAAAGAVAPGGAAYRYWRIFIATSNNSGDYMSLAEIELRAAIGGADLTSSSTPATASSQNSPSYAPSYTVDNSLDQSSSVWISLTTGMTDQWLRYDLGTPTVVLEVAMYPQTNVPTRSPKDFTIQGSNDGTNFTDVRSFTGITGWTSAWRNFAL